MSTQCSSTTVAVLLEKLIPCVDAVACLSESAARRLGVVPMGVESVVDSVRLLVGSSDPDNPIMRERLNRQLPVGTATRFIAVDASAIADALNRCYKNDMSSSELLQCCAAGASADSLEVQLPNATIRLVESLLVEAGRRRASDVHLSPEMGGVHVRLRVDGVLISFMMLHRSWLSRLVVRLKVLASMDIAESRLPQDGQFFQWLQSAYVDYRVSTFPTVAGENVVLRIMSTSLSMGSLHSLSLPEKTNRDLSAAINTPDGLVVVCGPTGSGKTTTLYALLNELDSTALNIMTLEDPVEIVVAGLRQSSIDPARTFDFSHGIRALLRQDPDVLMLGEVRDTQSCTMMLRAVMTGHRVLSTVHANTALGAIERMVELGVQPRLLAEHLTAVVSQRLIRLTCLACNASGAACSSCAGTGFFGRKAIMELVLIRPSIAALLASGASSSCLHDALVVEGFVELRKRAQDLVDDGLTTQKELERVLGVEPVAYSVSREETVPA